jgi:hypothetical protein
LQSEREIAFGGGRTGDARREFHRPASLALRFSRREFRRQDFFSHEEEALYGTSPWKRFFR